MRAALVQALSLGLACAACRAGRDHEPPRLALPERFEARADAVPAADEPQAASPAERAAAFDAELARWWTRLDDPLLAQLVERALRSSLDLEEARARVREARALLARARGERGPRLDARAGAAWVESSSNLAAGAFADPDPGELWQAGFDATWELDFFGRNVRAVEAARARADAAVEAGRDVQVTLCAEVARNYVELRAARKAAALTRANLAAQEETLELVRVRARAELSSELDVARAQNQAATTRALVPELEARASAARHRIEVLLGLAPGALAGELAADAPIPRAPELAAAGVPADLLRRRPDVRRAERDLAETSALSAQATAELYPRISLGATLGLESRSLESLLEADSRAFSVGPGLVAPLFHGGALRANVRAAEARQEAALARWRRTALEGLREVEDALVAGERERERHAALRAAFDAGDRALELARAMHREGLADFFDVLDAQRAALAAESALAESEGRLCAHAIAAYKALGGGWSE